MEKISKSKVISDAFKAKIPERSEWPSWYAERMALCEACSHNTKNGGLGEQLQWVAKKTGVSNCGICKCVIDRKCWSKSEACGLEEIGEKPKWNRILVKTTKDSPFNLVNKSVEGVNVDLSEDGTMFEFTTDPRRPDDDLAIRFTVECKDGKYELDEIHICSCIISKPVKLADGIYDIELKFINPLNLGRWFKMGSFLFRDHTAQKDEKGNLLEKVLLAKFKVEVFTEDNKVSNGQEDSNIKQEESHTQSN